MAKREKAYFGLSWVVSLILAIIPITAWILGIFVRLDRKNYVMAILNIPFGFIFWLIDLVSIILKKDLVVLA